MNSQSEVVEDGEEVLGEFVGGASQFWIENHDLPAVFLNEESEQVKAKAGKSVAVGNHRRELVSAQKSFQYGTQSFPLEVEAASDVLNDFCLGVEVAHSLDLSLQVIALLS